MVEREQLLTAPELAALCRVKLATLYDPRYRARVGLRARRLGRRLLFSRNDVERALRLEQPSRHDPDPADSIGSRARTSRRGEPAAVVPGGVE